VSEVALFMAFAAGLLAISYGLRRPKK